MSPGARVIASDRFRATMRAMTDRGVPESKLPEAFMWLARGHSWVGSMAGTTNIAARSINPLMDIDVLSLAMRLNRSDRSTHVLSFALLATASETRPLWDVPFAADRWPVGLAAVLSNAGWRRPMPTAVAPYVAHPAFPSGANRFIQNDRLAFARMMRCYTRRVLPDVGIQLVDPMSVRNRLHPDAPTNLGRMISELGAATVVLLAEFGRDAFRLSMRDVVLNRIREKSSGDDTPGDESMAEYRRVTTRHDEAIATLSQRVGPGTVPRPRSRFLSRLRLPTPRRIDVSRWESEIHGKELVIADLARRIRNEAPVLPAVDTPDTGTPKPKAKIWYHLDVANESDRPVEVRLTVNGVRGKARPVAAGAVRTIGVAETGTVLVTAEGVEPVTVDIHEGLLAYDVVLRAVAVRS
jgi:hypothetical protein